MDRTIGLLGGGQLGQMLCEAANPLGIKVIVLDKGHSPAKHVNARIPHIDGSFVDAEKIRELARKCDILTVEIEHVDTQILEEVAEEGVKMEDGRVKKVDVQPSWRTLRMIQDKYLQKDHLRANGVGTADSVKISKDTAEELAQVGRDLGYPYMLKARKDAYDGRGNFPVMKETDIPEALEGLKGRALYAERWAKFKMELAVMVVKTSDSGKIDSTIAYPAVETIHEDSVCKLVYAPARGVSRKIREAAQALARKAVASLWGKGVFGVEMFLLEDDSLLINEIAPRPHNSGHYTIEACPTFSQYKSQLLSILDLMPKMEKIPMAVPAAIMLNILGGAKAESHQDLIHGAISLPTANLHMYGKESKPGRKIGHITVIGDSMNDTEAAVSKLILTANNVRAERLPKATKSSPVKKVSPTALVAVTMGSDSDLPVLKPGITLLKEFGIPYFTTITSAHRTPEEMVKFAREAADNGHRVIIAAAGGAAHLPGMIASCTTLPVIGVPVRASTALDGVDSLYSIVQMPRGVPVATVGINNSVNAALLAIRILGSTDDEIQRRYEKYVEEMHDSVVVKARKLEEVGAEGY